MAWTFQQALGTENISAAPSLTFAGAVAAGDVIVVVLGTYQNATTVTSIVDPQGNTYTNATGYADGSSSRLSIWYAIAKSSSAGGTFQVTVNLSTSQYFALGILDYTPPAGTVAVDGTVNAKGGSTTPSCGSIPVTGSSDLCIAAYGNGLTSETATAGSGWTIRVHEDSAAYSVMAAEDQLNVSSSPTGNFTLSTSTTWVAAGVSFKVTGGGSTAAAPIAAFARRAAILGTGIV